MGEAKRRKELDPTWGQSQDEKHQFILQKIAVAVEERLWEVDDDLARMERYCHYVATLLITAPEDLYENHYVQLLTNFSAKLADCFSDDLKKWLMGVPKEISAQAAAKFEANSTHPEYWDGLPPLNFPSGASDH